MQAIGLIVEYNPLHNGHIHHINEAKKRFPTATVIAILNGNFLQRGEPAIACKYTRAHWALQAGCDLVLELPFAFGTQRADIFAHGAIQIAQAFNVDAIVYGVETTALQPTSCDQLLPNQRLAFFYQQAIEQSGKDIQAVPIERIHSNYLDTELQHPHIASATAIRQKLKTSPDQIAAFLPTYVYKTIIDQPIPTVANYFPYLKHCLIYNTCTPPALTQSGLYTRITKALEQTQDFTTFFQYIHSKHTSKTHIQRALTYMMCHIPQQQLDDASKHIWTKILGSSSKGRIYLKHLKTTTGIPIPVIQTLSDIKNPHYMLQYNNLVAYALVANIPLHALLEREYNKKIILFP